MDAMENNVFRASHQKSNNNDMNDLDDLIKQLEEKGNKKKKNDTKLPMITTRDKFHKQEKK